MPRAGIGLGSRIVIIGLGYFGRALAQTSHELGYEVLAIDVNERLVQDATRYTALAIQGDGTDEELLRGLQVDRSDVGIVALGTNLEASILSTMLLKKLGVRYLISKAKTDLHGDVLREIGANRVVFPEHDEGVELAHALAVPSIDDYISLTPTAGVAKATAPASMVGKTLSQLLESAGAQVSVLLIRRGSFMIATPSFNERIEAGDDLIVSGPDVQIEQFMEGSERGSRG
ncbi:TrkA family potassium uptake protein [soil metagenome]